MRTKLRGAKNRPRHPPPHKHYPSIFTLAENTPIKEPETSGAPNRSKKQDQKEKKKMVKEGKEMTVIRGLDLQRYTGRWYEIASIPSFFQPKDGRDTRATYSLNADGTVRVLNETWSRGKRDFIEGSAYKANPNDDEAKFKVKFYVPPFLPIIPVTGNYWVLYLDSEYSYALIGEPTRSYLWILSRTTHIDDATYNLLLEKAKEEGYDIEKLHNTPQSDPPPQSDDASPNEKKGIWWIKSLFGK